VPAATGSVVTGSVVAGSVVAGTETPIRYAEFTGGKVYLRGTVPDQATAELVRAKTAAVVGEANVVVEYDIVPGTPVPNDAPLYVRDSILFAPGSTKLNPTATAVLDLGVLLFAQNPQMTMVVEGHTDSVGSPEDNLALSQARVDAILAYFASKGVNPSRVSGIAKGESDPQASNDTAEGRALNRRVEAQIINLLG
jgi:OmpA-OmpF porin, OOP family